MISSKVHVISFPPWALLALLSLGNSSALAQANPLEKPVKQFLAQHCLECHKGEKPKGDFRLDRLSTNFADEVNRQRWQNVRRRVKEGEMPPKSKPRPTQNEVDALCDWIDGMMAAQAAKSDHGRVVLRRLNRVEYQNTMRDLLRVDIDLREMLPIDSSAAGFDNVAQAHHVSSFLMERYLEAADAALNVAIVSRPQPPIIKKRYSLKDQHTVKTATERVYRIRDNTVVLFSSSHWNAVTLYEFYPPDRGRYRFRISASGVQSAGKPVTYRVDAGPMLMGTKSHLIGYFDAPADKPAVVEFVDHLEARSTIRIHPYGLAGAQTVHPIGADDYKGPGLAVQSVEVEGPLHDTWPPASHRRLFGNLQQAPSRDDQYRLEVVSKNSAADAERILRDFARRAFRRPVTDDDIKPFVALVKAKLAPLLPQPNKGVNAPAPSANEGKQGHSFEQAVRVGLLAVLLSPEFLFLRETPLVVPPSGGPGGKTTPVQKIRQGSGKLDDFALASRLSYFLRSTMPDDELLALAEVGQPFQADQQARQPFQADSQAGKPDLRLSHPSTLRRQVERMLNDPKAAAFTENFVGQWLGLRDIDFTEPSHILYPEYDDMLRASMIRETELFFAEVLKHDLSLTNFVASDFSMLNGRLAKHYGIPTNLSSPLGGEGRVRGSSSPLGGEGRVRGLDGWEFRKAPLPAGSHRGGVMTMASVLKVTANGTSTSPVTRGAWVLERILGTPPPKPPADVPAIEPDIRGATTIRQQLAKHRQVASCAGCHAKIDPPGFALESFDVIGGWRDHYRSTGNGAPVVIDGRTMPYYKGLKIDPSDVLPDGRRFADIDEFKKLLLQDKDQLARALTEKLLTYATGAPPTPADKPEIEAIVRNLRAKNYGFRTLIHEIVQSKVFQYK